MEPETRAFLETALSRTLEDMRREFPAAMPLVLPWLDRLSRGKGPIGRFLEPLMFPLFEPPFWVEEGSGHDRDEKFLEDLAVSTLNGYYFLRLVDEVMDGHSTTEKTFLSVSAFFHTKFQFVYQGYFPSDHPFWAQFTSIWLCTNEVTIAEKGSEPLTEEGFVAISANKLAALKIPVLAACYHYGQMGEISSWIHFCDTLGQFFQMLDDACDWRTDLIDGQPSFFLAEAERKRSQGESIEAWILRDGLPWAKRWLHQKMSTLEASAESLGSVHAERYLRDLQTRLDERWDLWSLGLEELGKLARELETAAEGGTET